MKRARLLRYARCQVTDYFIERGFVTGFFSLILLTGPAIDIVFSGRRLLPPTVVMAALSTLIFVTVMFGSQAIISLPRKMGYYKLILSKPVSPLAYYAQAFLVNFLCVVILTALIAWGWGTIVGSVNVVAVGILTAVAFVLLGGVGFLASAIVNYDSVLVFAFFALSVVAKDAAAMYTGIGPRAVNLLMPTDHLLALRQGLLPGGTFANGDLAWVIGYGLAFFLLGCFALRYRQLAD